MRRTPIWFVVVLGLAAPVLGQRSASVPRDGSWRGGFEAPGVGVVNALALFDDGSGPALYAGGTFGLAGGVAVWGIARWNGVLWESIGGVGGGARDVFALAVYDDGDGKVLVCAGDFTSVGGVPASKLAAWDGLSWSEFGGGMPVNAKPMALLAEPGEANLFVGGNFINIAGVAMNNVSRWNGSSWSPLGEGIPATVTSIGRFAGELFVGSEKDVAGVVPTLHSWSDASWSSPADWPDDTVSALLAFDDGSSGERLYVGGGFASVGGLAATGIAAFDGTDWSTVGSAIGTATAPAWVHDLAVLPDSTAGDRLVAAGQIPGDPLGTELENVALWDGASWSPVATGAGDVDNTAHAVVFGDLGTGAELFLGGRFFAAGGSVASCIASWDGIQWRRLGRGYGIPGEIADFEFHDDGAGPSLFAAGDFLTLGSIVRWNGAGWSLLPTYPDGRVNSIVSWDDGTGPALYAGGNFLEAGGVPAPGVARWDGQSWTTVGGGTDPSVNSLRVLDDGAGPALYAAGSFDTAGGLPAFGIARWDGETWSVFGGGLLSRVSDAAVFDFGDGPALVAAGGFDFGLSKEHVAVFENGAWSDVPGGGATGTVLRLQAISEPSLGGPMLLASARSFTTFTGASSSPGIAAWKPGRNWTPLGAGFEELTCRPVVTGSQTGLEIIAAGILTGRSREGLVRWDGRSWHEMGGPVGGVFSPFDIDVLLPVRRGPYVDLWVGGDFDFLGPNVSKSVDVWRQRAIASANR